jgi:hypothetical protein
VNADRCACPHLPAPQAANEFAIVRQSLAAASDVCGLRAGSSGDLLPPSPPAEKATASQDQAGQASTDDGAGDKLASEISPLGLAVDRRTRRSLPEGNPGKRRYRGGDADGPGAGGNAVAVNIGL